MHLNLKCLTKLLYPKVSKPRCKAQELQNNFDEVKMVVGKTGAGEVPTDPMPPEATDMMIILKPQDEWKSGRTYDELGDAIKKN